VLQNFYHLNASDSALYFFPFAIGNLLGPLVLGPLFDTLGRRKMIFGTYFLAGFVLLISAYLFKEGALTATTHTLFWCVSFFFASAGAAPAHKGAWPSRIGLEHGRCSGPRTSAVLGPD
jgi:MFS family permease